MIKIIEYLRTHKKNLNINKITNKNIDENIVNVKY